MKPTTPIVHDAKKTFAKIKALAVATLALSILPVYGEAWTAKTMLADTPYKNGISSNSNGRYRIPALARAPGGTMVAAFDLRYNNSGDLPNAIDIGECWSGDAGLTWTAPCVGVDADNSNYYSKQCDIGDPCILFDPGGEKFWLMGLTGGGLARSHSSAGASISDVVLYTRETGKNDVWEEWNGGPSGNERSVKQMILDSLAAVDSGATADEDSIRGILQGPGHGISQSKAVHAPDGSVLMPSGALVFPMQYFPSKNDFNAYAFAVYSKDGGKTWQSTKLVPSGEYSQENSVMELDDGSWYMICKGKKTNDRRRQLFRTTDYVNWTYCGSLTPSEWVQGSCLRLGKGSDGKGRYAACFSPSGRSDVTVYFGRDTTADDPGGTGVAWDLGSRIVYPGSTGGMGYNSLAMLDDQTLGILIEADGHIYFLAQDVSDIVPVPSPEPIAVWDGDFSSDALEKHADAGYTLVDWNQTHGEEHSSVTIDRDNQGLMFNADKYLPAMTILVKYSGLKAGSRKRVLFATSVSPDHENDRTGVQLQSDGKLVGLWYDEPDPGHDIDYGTPSGSIPESGVMAFTYERTAGTFLYHGEETSSISSEAAWGDKGLKSAYDEYLYGAGIGGMYKGVGGAGNDAEAAKGMTIYGVAIFDRVLTSDEMRAYEWPSSKQAAADEDEEFDPAKDTLAEGCVLRISEIMPKPTDAQNRGALEGMDENGLESGWVELENTSGQWANLADYRFIRVNRGKKTDPAGAGNFPAYYVAPHSRMVFYTSERYSNSKDKAVSAFEHGTFDGRPIVTGDELHNMVVWGDKVNPKKSPFVRLYYAPGGDDDEGTIVDTVVVPSDLPEGWSIIVADASDGKATERWMCPAPTRGRENGSTAGLTRIGPNAGPLYELANLKKHDSANEFARTAPPAKPGEDYEITFSFNPVMHPTAVAEFRDEDALASISLVYRKDLDDSTRATVPVSLQNGKFDSKDWGWTYTAAIPASALPAAGHLVQWKFVATDACGNEWTSPSFHNPDDGYEWYGTIVEPGELNSATLPTWHMFATPESLAQMDIDASAQTLANNARVGIYDSSTSNYYDYVRIDLRGNTSARFTKKSHGLRFAKAHPLTMRDVVSGDEIEEIRKTSLVSEFADPSYMRQMVAFWLWRKMGNLVPFDFPVRCNLNGEFYQLAFNSERFTDELVEDVYGLDKFGFGYKNVGTLRRGSSSTAGGIEKKTPDDEDESNITVLENELRSRLKDLGAEKDNQGDNAELTKFVAENFDLPAWINYLASARITQETDDVWANICIYWDNPEMKEGVRGTGAWMPLGYDFNLSFGQWYFNDLDNGSHDGLMAAQDWFKSHPFYGGNRVRCYKSDVGDIMINYGNSGIEAVWQSAKFRRLYLRRLRTLMDAELKEPGTPESDTPFMAKMRELADLMRADAALDQAKWPNDSTDDAIDVWRDGATRPADIDAGVDDIWENYVVPRRAHLYVTHSVTNGAFEVGYGRDFNAGIPEAQSPLATLAPNISIANMTTLGDDDAAALGVDRLFYDTESVVVRNDNAEAVDMSGWRLAFAADFVFPSGTVCDANDSIYIVADRRAYVEKHSASITDEVIVGNAAISGGGPIALYDASGALVYSKAPKTAETESLRLHSFCGNTADGGDAGEWFVLTNISDSVSLDLAGVVVCFLKQGDDHDSTAHCHVTLENKKGAGTLAPLASIRLDQADWTAKGWTKIQNNKLDIKIYDKYGSVCQSLKVAQKNFKLAYGNGGWLVCDSTAAAVAGDSSWHQEPTATQTTPVPVPFSELEDRFAAYLAQANGDYEVAAMLVGKNGCAIWESYLAGLDPDDENSRFVAKIAMAEEDGERVPVVTWEPDSQELRDTRIYTKFGKGALRDENWSLVADGDERNYRFFKVEVRMRQASGR